MIEKHRKHPFSKIYLDNKQLVCYYADGDSRNVGEAQIESGADNSLFSILTYQEKKISVIGRMTIQKHRNREQTYIYKLEEVSEEMRRWDSGHATYNKL